MRQNGTNSEQILWRVLRGKQLGVTFRRQVPIGPFIVDFLAPSIHLAVKVDGPIHARTVAADTRRDEKLRRLGFTVLRLQAEVVERQLPVVLRRIREGIATTMAATAASRQLG